MQPRRKNPWLPLGLGLTLALASVLVYLKLKPKPPPPRPTLSNSLGMTFVEIPAGKFLMGSPPGDKERQPDETQHEVEITRPFYLGITEVTQGQYQQVMGDNPTVRPPASDPHHQDYAVENVSWDEAVEFCKRLSELPAEKAAGRTYRLPTEAEWEYACRAGGEEDGSLDKHGWYSGNARGEVHPARSLKENAWDLFGMRGGVWEWCSDWYDKDYYQRSPLRDPQGPDTGSARVARGGSWNDPASDCRCARRLALAPGIRLGMGFRVVLVRAALRRDEGVGMVRYSFPGKVVLVTGSSRGMGAAILEAFAQAEAVCVVNYFDDADGHNRRDADETAERLRRHGATVHVLAGDVSHYESVEALMKRVVEVAGGLDVLVNNAGILRDRTVKKMTLQEWDSVLTTNLDGVFYCSKLGAEVLRDGGRIVNVSSISGVVGFHGQANYAAAKAGVIALTKVMAKELARRGITVNAVAPGVIQTPMLGALKPEVLAEYEKQIPAGRIGRPEDVAHAVLFFACEESSYITGQTLPITGGWF